MDAISGISPSAATAGQVQSRQSHASDQSRRQAERREQHTTDMVRATDAAKKALNGQGQVVGQLIHTSA
ncbi:hypothetical protein KSF73_12565 [Burkholderiaceae bacterium DAT-1]|nr:hypothetical protein [Burkholderiaceae bacterium DAT-1]